MAQSKAKENVIHIRLDDQEMKAVKDLADIYDIKMSEVVRYAIAYIQHNRPILGKRFAPESATA